MADDYEIVPEKDFDSLKHAVDEIKKDPIGNTVQGKGLKESVDSLNSSIKQLLDLFKTTAESMKMEEHDNSLVSQKIGPLFEKVERLSEQNEKIAKGIVALAEMVDAMKGSSGNSASGPQKPPYSDSIRQPQPAMPRQPGQFPQQPQPLVGGKKEFFSPPPQGPSPLPRTEVPPMPSPPPMQHKKKGLFGLGK